ncbi:phytanoyl-CoA dioxygenase family protein [Agriterribacter sp.]|uniref:phytanoyl-CoA dioxygenase family protein n=1 Tax=Agriterribacter sp. TaxID=2821509 RepID=UPI002BD0B425|nr:phytanoyl-CoA dioxygenase family protein [Agriterribacter sp.]HRP55465.1 phytanoyl-CoA dioxygenase family protein [Agriterribacter sp.]
MAFFQLNQQQIDSFNTDGYLIVKGLLSEEETLKLSSIALKDGVIKNNALDLNDKSGKKTRLTSWYIPGNDVYGLLTRSERIVKSVDKLLDGNAPVCHFHSKLMQKEPKVGGAWEWHQDYGYWYKNEFLFPDQMISVMIAITEGNKENGCLQVIRGSHKMGRVEHGFSGEQVGAALHYVELALKTMDLVYVELKPGDVLFFHSNILHRSEANLSDSARWSLISCYNRASNKAYNESSDSHITPIKIVPDEALLNWNTGTIDSGVGFVGKGHIHKEEMG